ncbi:hypothetical protein [Pimelobacter simplex]|uniref:hypothetical protein n=1 Tax=Nocardioides simplex TaxID=2045 RepID=UPI003AABAB3F
MNETEKTRIAAAINQLRPDWPTTSLRTLLDRPMITHRPRRDVAVALTWVACETDSKTPARVLEAGPWWQAVSVNGIDVGGAVTNGVLDPTTACDVCSLPAHRHTNNGGHEFVSVADATRARTVRPKPRRPRTKETQP